MRSAQAGSSAAETEAGGERSTPRLTRIGVMPRQLRARKTGRARPESTSRGAEVPQSGGASVFFAEQHVGFGATGKQQQLVRHISAFTHPHAWPRQG